MPDDDPKNRMYPGEFNYGGGHVIEEYWWRARISGRSPAPTAPLSLLSQEEN